MSVFWDTPGSVAYSKLILEARSDTFFSGLRKQPMRAYNYHAWQMFMDNCYARSCFFFELQCLTVEVPR